MKKYFGIGILALAAALSLGCFAACSETGTAGGTGGNYKPGKNSHLLKEGETTCEHCGEQLFEGTLKFTLSDNQKYYTVSGFGDASGDVVVPDFYCSRGDDTYLPVLELSGNTGDKVEALEIPAVAEDCKIYSGKGLKEVRVAAGNSQYAVKNGVLYDDTLTELLLYPVAKEGSTFSVPAKVKKIGNNAFENSSGLTGVDFASDAALKSIGDSAFSYCENLRSVVIPAGVETLGNGAFYSSGVTSVEFAQGSVLKTIGDSAFSHCENLRSVVIPAGVETLGDGTFYSSGVTSVEFAQGSALKTIGDTAFMFCNSIEQIIIPASVENMGDRVFDGWGWYGQQRICVPFAANDLPAGWSAEWLDGINDDAIIEYNYTGN